MMTLPELAAGALEKFLATHVSRTFGASQARFGELLPAAARIALGLQQTVALGNIDATRDWATRATLSMRCGSCCSGRWPTTLSLRRARPPGA